MKQQQLMSLEDVLKRGTRGKGCQIADNVHIGKGCMIGDQCILKPGVILAQGTILGSKVFLGPGSTTIREQRTGAKGPYIAPGTKIMAHCLIEGSIICEGVIVGAMSWVKKDIMEPGIYWGVPAKKRNYL